MAALCNLLVILGPTASGKSQLAMALVRAVRAEILSVDSMQVYRGMDIGTAKPTSAEREQVRHHLIDVVDPDEIYTVARFVEEADRVIAGAAARGVRLIATGGTPLYYKALFEGLFDGPPADETLRQRLGELDGETLLNRLREVDPATAARLHANDRKRLIRALEVFEITGSPISSFQKEWGSGVLRHPATWVGLSWERDELNRRINARAREMLAAGWLDETRMLLARHSSLSATASLATGYPELIQHLEGKITLDEAIEQIKIATRQLARKQMKWMRRFESVRWMEGKREVEELVEDVLRNWNQTS